jgi:hypothetical protein
MPQTALACRNPAAPKCKASPPRKFYRLRDHEASPFFKIIKCVYEVDPLTCPKCGGEMRIISFIEEDVVIEKILRHCGLWKEPLIRPPPTAPPPALNEPTLDYGFFETTCS